MYMIDFEFDGKMLSDYNMMIGYIGTTDDNTPIGSPLSPNLVKIGDINKITSTTYEDVITKTISIIKNPCNDNTLEFTDNELYEVSTWLQTKSYKMFKPIYNDGSFTDIHFYGRFDINAIYNNGTVIGFELTLTTNSPYGFGEEEENSYTINSSNNEISIFNDSQEFGYLYFNTFTITCNSSGTLYLRNTNDISVESGETYLTKIENCESGETITIDCKNKIITTDSDTHAETLFDDFNWNYPRLVTDFSNPLNVFTVDTSNLSSVNITVNFEPVRKVGVI